MHHLWIVWYVVVTQPRLSSGGATILDCRATMNFIPCYLVVYSIA